MLSRSNTEIKIQQWGKCIIWVSGEQAIFIMWALQFKCVQEGFLWKQRSANTVLLTSVSALWVSLVSAGSPLLVPALDVSSGCLRWKLCPCNLHFCAISIPEVGRKIVQGLWSLGGLARLPLWSLRIFSFFAALLLCALSCRRPIRFKYELTCMLKLNELTTQGSCAGALSYAEFVFSHCYEGHPLTYGIQGYPLACMCLPLKADVIPYGPIASFASAAFNLGIYI